MTNGMLFQKNGNLLPYDGEVYYYGSIFDPPSAEEYYQILMKEIDWKNDEVVLFGKKMVTKRKVAWYGDHAYPYRYSNATKIALPWTPILLEIKKHIEEKSQKTFNSCLLNLYHNGQETMAWHSDGEKDLQKNGAIASMSFGAERKFSFKHKSTKKTISLILERGSLLIMQGNTQTHWLHRLPPTKKVHVPRINLTFRTIDTTVFPPF